MTTREKFGSLVAAIRCPNKECHDKGFTMYPEDMEDNILPCLCHGCGKMFYVEIDQEESLEEELEERKIENLSEESNEILDREEKTAKRRRISKEKETRRPERRIDRQKIEEMEEEPYRKHTSFLTNFEDDDDEIYDEEDDFDFEQYQKRLKKRQDKKKKETEHRRRERPEYFEDSVEENKKEGKVDIELSNTQQDAEDYEDDWEEFSFVKKSKKYMSPERKSEQRSIEKEKIASNSFDDFSFESDLLKCTEKEEKRNLKKKKEKKSVFDEETELDREFEAMLDDDSDEWLFGDEKKSDFGKLRNIFQRKNHK